MSQVFKVCRNENLTAYDTFNEDTFQGPTNVTEESYYFSTEEYAMQFYRARKTMLRVAGGAGTYYTYPVTVEDPDELEKAKGVIDECRIGD